jgi:activator of 2-hydroxyglutaryl-CoA dehydratase
MTQKLVNGVLLDLTPEEEAQREIDYLTNQTQIEKNQVLNEIKAIEAMITSRRTREAILGIDSGWLAEQDIKISALREQL